MVIIMCLGIFLWFGCYSLHHKLSNVARREERAEWEEKLENHEFEPYVATKQKTIDARGVATTDENYYRNCLPASQSTELARMLRKRICDEVGVQPTAEMVTCAILAQDGKVPYELRQTTYMTSPAEPRREHWKVEHRFLEWLDRELERKQMPYRVKFVPIGTLPKYAEHFNSDQITLEMGNYIWHSDQAFVGSYIALIRCAYDYNAPFVEYK